MPSRAVRPGVLLWPCRQLLFCLLPVLQLQLLVLLLLLLLLVLVPARSQSQLALWQIARPWCPLTNVVWSGFTRSSFFCFQSPKDPTVEDTTIQQWFITWTANNAREFNGLNQEQQDTTCDVHIFYKATQTRHQRAMFRMNFLVRNQRPTEVDEQCQLHGIQMAPRMEQNKTTTKLS